MKPFVLVPAAARWYWGILVSGRFKLGSSLRMSKLSFRLLLFAVFADLHLVFRLGIFVGNFIFSFLLFSCRIRTSVTLLSPTGNRTAGVSSWWVTLAVELALVNSLELLLG